MQAHVYTAYFKNYLNFEVFNLICSCFFQYLTNSRHIYISYCKFLSDFLHIFFFVLCTLFVHPSVSSVSWMMMYSLPTCSDLYSARKAYYTYCCFYIHILLLHNIRLPLLCDMNS